MAEGGYGPPQLREISQDAIRRAVRNEALTHPLTLYPTVGAVLGGLVWAVFGAPMFLWAAFGGSLLGVTSLIVNYCFRDRVLGGTYVRKLNERLSEHNQQLVSTLIKDLEGCSDVHGAEERVKQGLEQFAKIRPVYDNLRTLLEQMPLGGELEYGRIWVASEQAYLGVLDNLRDAVTTLKSVSTIEPDHVRRSIERLSALPAPTEADRRETATLEKRLGIRDEQLRRVDEILARNEETITQMEETTAAIATRGSDDTFADVSPEKSAEHLRQLAEKIRSGRQQGEVEN
jgi:hypothetical protein